MHIMDLTDKHSFIKCFFTLFLSLCLIVALIPRTSARADYRLGPERYATYDISDGELYDEYGRVDFKTRRCRSGYIPESVLEDRVKKASKCL